MPLSLRPNIDPVSFLPLHSRPWSAYNKTQSSPRPSNSQQTHGVPPAYGPKLLFSANLAVKQPTLFSRRSNRSSPRDSRARRYPSPTLPPPPSLPSAEPHPRSPLLRRPTHPSTPPRPLSPHPDFFFPYLVPVGPLSRRRILRFRVASIAPV